MEKVRSIEVLRESKTGLSQPAVLTEWRKILEVNYWPIFDIARRILVAIPSAVAREIIEVLADTADQLTRNRLMRSHDLTGAVFQKLIADRRFLAAYYTTPAAAALLAGLAITEDMLPAGLSWASAADLGRLRIGDMACGTGTLVSTAYQRIGQLHEINGGYSEALHPDMMGGGLVGCDVLPAAAHLTASMLAGAHPTVTYQQSSIYTVAYGKQTDGDIALGSIDLLDEQVQLETLAITSRAADPAGETDVNVPVKIPHKHFHLVIMNPPFTRPTGHEGQRVGVPNPMFAAFNSPEEEQREMGKAMKSRTRKSSYHGNAGEASAFLPLAHRKLKPDGVLALVMPLSLLAGDAWEKSRKLIADNYTDLVAVSIASPKDGTVAFSSDTRTADCLIVGRKKPEAVGLKRTPRAVFVMLNARPAYPLVGAEIARQIRRLIAAGAIRQLEDGPVGGTPIKFGDGAIGQAIDAPLPAFGSWSVSRITDLSLAQTAYQLAKRGRLWLPAQPESSARDIPTTTIEEIGTIGPYHADINGKDQRGGFRGPFDIEPVGSSAAPTFPVLWTHDAGRERTIVFEADSEGLARKAKDRRSQAAVDEKRERVWESASHLHVNRDFRFNSQSTSMQFTTARTIGGHAWPSVSLKTVELEKVMALWGNTTLGMLMYWWHANKQQTGRGRLGVKSIKTLPILDVPKLPKPAIARAVAIFDELSNQPLWPLNEIDHDLVRRKLDTAFCRDVLGLPGALLADGGPLDRLRHKMANEPSIDEGKQSRVGVTADGADEDEEDPGDGDE